MAFIHNYNESADINVHKIKTDIVDVEAKALFQLSNIQTTIF